ncbi:MAG: nitroreductase [Dyella sp.]
MSDPLAFLLQRHSAPSRQLAEPAPTDAQLRRLLEAAIRVPDHGKLEPFRILKLHGEAKLALGERLAALAHKRDPQMSESKLEKERNRYRWAPLVLVVIARLATDSKVPPLEQQLTAGCVAYNLLLGAQALGYGAQWLTGWAAHDKNAAALLGLADNEQVIGFVHIGTPQIEVPDRERPSLDHVLSVWTA